MTIFAAIEDFPFVPVRRRHTVHRRIDISFGCPVKLRHDRFQRKSEPFRNSPALQVVYRTADFDPLQAQPVERVTGHRLAGGGHDAAPLPVRAQPVTQLSLRTTQVNIIVADYPSKLLIAPYPRVHAAAARLLS